MQSLPRSPIERFVAWVLTGPLGHLWSAVADVALLLARYSVARVRGRVRERASRRYAA